MHREPPASLREKIIQTLIRKQRQQARWRFGVLGSISVIAVASLVPTGTMLFQSLSQSGFWQYVLLLTTDQSILLNAWRELSFSLIESLPLMSLCLVLVVSMILVWSASRALKNYNYLWI